MTLGELAGPLAWAGACHLAMWEAGARLRPWLFRAPIRDEAPAERAFLSAMLGFTAFASAAVVLAALRLLYAPLIAAAVAVLAAAGGWRLSRVRWREARSRLSARLPLAVGILVVLGYVPIALYPVLEHDESVYHLLLPKLYLGAHGFVALPWNLYANMPHLVDLSYVIPTALGEFTAAKLFVLGFAAWTILGLASFGAETLGWAGPGILALLYLSGRNVQWHLGLTYVEPVIGALLLGAVLSLRRWWNDRGEPGHLRMLGILAGAACASKYTVWPHVAALCAVVALVRTAPGSLARAKRLAIVVGAAAALTAPWLVKDAIVTGNPIYPNAYGILGGAHWSAIQDVQFHRYLDSAGGTDRSWRNVLLLPLNLVVRPFRTFGSASFSAGLMAFFLLSLARPWRRGDFATVLRLVAVAGFIAWASGSRQGRFLVAWVPVMVLAATPALAPLRNRRIAFGALAALLAAGAWVQVRRQPYPAPSAADVFSIPRRELLSRNSCWDLTEFLNRTVPEGGRVLSLWEDQLYFLDRPFIADSVFEAPAVLASLRETGDPDAFARRMAAAGITHVVINPVQYTNYTRDRFPEEILDERVYPAEKLLADRKLLSRFLVTHLERVPWEGRWPVFTLRVASTRPD